MKKFFALVALVCTVMISSTAMAAANWVWIYSDKDYTIYVDNNSIRRDYNYSDYVFRAFVKWIYSDTGRNKTIERWRSNDKPLPRGIYNLSHDIRLEYFKASGGIKYHTIVNCVYYNHDGNKIHDMSFSYSTLPQWFVITPESIGEAIFDAVYARVPN